MTGSGSHIPYRSLLRLFAAAPAARRALWRLFSNPAAACNLVTSFRELRSGSLHRRSEPVMLQLEVTSRCNYQCRYCIVHNGTETETEPRDMDLSIFREILDRFPRAFYLQLQGQGEPLLHPDLPAMVRLAKASRRMCAVVTNGSLWTEERTGQLLQAGLDIVAFSLDLCSDKRMASYRRGMNPATVRANLTRVLEERRRLKSPVVVGVSAVLLPAASLSEQIEALKQLDELGVDFVMIGPLANTFPYRERYPPDLASEAERPPDFSTLRALGFRCAVFTTPAANSVAGRCFWPWSALYVNYDGTVSYCANNHRCRIGHARDGDVLNLAVHQRVRAQFGRDEVPDGCRGCQYLVGG